MPATKAIQLENKRIEEYLSDQLLIDWNKELDQLYADSFKYETVMKFEGYSFTGEIIPLVPNAKELVEAVRKKIYNYTKEYYPDLF